MKYYSHYNDNQFLFDRSLSGLAIAGRLALKIGVYLPLLFAGYIMTDALLTKQDTILLRIGLIGLFALACYGLVFFMKGMLIALKSQRHRGWIPLFLACVAITCLLPVYAIYAPLHQLIVSWTHESADGVTNILAIAWGIFVYAQYHFLTNIAPVMVFPVYQLGIDCSCSLLRMKNPLRGNRARAWI